MYYVLWNQGVEWQVFCDQGVGLQGLGIVDYGVICDQWVVNILTISCILYILWSLGRIISIAINMGLEVRKKV